MKHSRAEAQNVVRMFERHLITNIEVRNYFTKEFFHVFEISPISIDGENKNQIRFKDTLVDGCISMRGNISDVEDYVKACFHNAY